MYLIAILFPPLAVLICGKPVQCLLNIFLSLLLYFPGMIHAILVVSESKANARNKNLIKAIEKQEAGVRKSMLTHAQVAQRQAQHQLEAFSPPPPQLQVYSQTQPLPAASIPLPPGAERRFRIASNGEELGELSVSAIQKMLTAGKLTMQDYYLDRDANDWMPLDCLPDLV